MPVAAVAIAAVGLGLSVYQTVDAKKKQKESEKDLKEYERQKLTNPYENLQVSTRGSEIQQEAVNNQVSTTLDNLRAGGSRAIMGGMPTLYDFMMRSNQQIAANLDQQEKENQQLAAQGNAMVQNMTEQREKDDLIGIGNAINTARQEYTNGLNNSIQSLSSLASASGSLNSGKAQSENNNQVASAGGTGLFSKPAVASKNIKFNNQVISSDIKMPISKQVTSITPKVPINQKSYNEMIEEYNRMQFGRR